MHPPRIFWLILTASLTNGSVGAIRITPGMVNIDKIVAASPEGSSFIFGQGTYRLLQLVVKDKDVFRAEPGTILSGAVLITNYIRAGNLWMVPNQRQRGQVHGVCDSQHPLCTHPEDLYFDDKPLEPVASLSLVKSGKWFFDYSNHTIYFADDPAGHTLEASVARSAFSGNAKDITIDGFVVEKYAIPAQFGAIGDQYPGPHWIVNHNEVRLNHGRGINVSNDSTVTRNYVHNNGQSGIGTGNSRNVLVQNNEIAFNNYAGFDTGWEAGGFKAAVTTDLQVKDNYVHDNAGPGLWSDIDSSATRYTGNTVAHNSGSGIIVEISSGATIADNTVYGNYRPGDTWVWGAQILIQNSAHVDVSGNVIEVSPNQGHGIVIVQQDRGSGRDGPHDSIKDYVHHNSITYLKSPQGATGVAADFREKEFLAADNRFDYNHYHVTDVTAPHWVWGQYCTWLQFKATGQETHGTMDTNSGAAPSYRRQWN